MHEESTFQQHVETVYREVRDGERGHSGVLPHLRGKGKGLPSIEQG